jgi:uncharacterized protein (DUF697 family)
MATETVQTTQSKQPGKQEFKQEVSTETPDGTHHEIKYEHKIESKPESAAANPYARIAMADAIVSRNVLWALGAGIVPIPLVDVVAIMGIEIKMLKELSDLYGVGFRANVAKKIIYSLLSSLGSVGLGGAVGFSLSKFIPGIGSTLGVVSVPIFAGAVTHALGRLFLMHFESGGTLLNFDPHAMRSHFKQEFERSREKVAQMRREEAR